MRMKHIWTVLSLLNENKYDYRMTMSIRGSTIVVHRFHGIDLCCTFNYWYPYFCCLYFIAECRFKIFRMYASYIIGYFNHSGTITDLVSHAAYVVCVNFMHFMHSLKPTSKDRNFSCQKSADKKLSKKYFFLDIRLNSLNWPCV